MAHAGHKFADPTIAASEEEYVVRADARRANGHGER